MLAKIFFLSCITIACASSRQDRPDLYQHWIHLHEEDNTNEGYRTYRPSSYPFPPARGRDGFEIKTNGIIISHPIAPADGNLDIEEKWELQENKLIIQGKDHISRFEIISLSKEKLVLKPLQ